MLCLMSSSHPDRSDVGGQSHRLAKRKAEAESDDEDLSETPTHGARAAKRPASGEHAPDVFAMSRSQGIFERENPAVGHWFNPSGRKWNQANVSQLKNFLWLW